MKPKNLRNNYALSHTHPAESIHPPVRVKKKYKNKTSKKRLINALMFLNIYNTYTMEAQSMQA
jgi:hypothetical protein